MSHVDRTSISSGAGAELAAVNKTTKYSDMLHDYHYVPVAVETLGPWCDAAMNFITQLGRRMTVVRSVGDCIFVAETVCGDTARQRHLFCEQLYMTSV